METTIKKLFSDPPFGVKFEALMEDHAVLDKPAGPLVIVANPELIPPLIDIATTVVDGDVVTFTLTGKPGKQRFEVSDGVARAGLHLTVTSTAEVDAQLTEVAAPVQQPPSTAKGVTNAD